MKKTNRKGILKSLLSILCAVMLLVGVGAHSVYADEEVPVQPNVEGLSVDEANALIDEYNEKVDAYNEAVDVAYEAEIEEVEAHNAAEDQKVEENQKELEAYNAAQEKIEKHEDKGITTDRTSDPDELPEDYTVTVETQEAKTIKVEEAEVKAGKTVKVMNVHLFFDEGCGSTVSINDLSNLKSDEDVNEHLALAEWETVEVDENDIVTVISEAESMGYKSASFYKWIEGYTNGFWMPSYSVFGSTAVDSYSTWYKGAAQVASYDMGTTDGRDPVDMFSLYAYTFYRTGAEPAYVEEYTPDYKETPQAPEHLNKMDHIEAKEPAEKEEEPEKKDTVIVVPAPENNDPSGNDPIVNEPAAAPETKKQETVPAKTEEAVVEIPEEIVPQVDDTEEFIDEPVPMAAPAAEAHWALLNLIAMIATALVALLAILGIFKKNDEDKEEEEMKAVEEKEEEKEERGRGKILTAIPALLSIIAFLLTEDMRLKMALIDRWTLLMVIILIVNIILAFLTRNRKKEEEEEEEKMMVLTEARAVLE